MSHTRAPTSFLTAPPRTLIVTVRVRNGSALASPKTGHSSHGRRFADIRCRCLDQQYDPRNGKSVHVQDRSTRRGANQRPAFTSSHLGGAVTRRQLLYAGSSALALGVNEWQVEEAKSLVIFPQRLKNRYIVVRHGESDLDVQGRIQSNPGFKYDVQWGLTGTGRDQMHAAADYILDELDASPSWIYTSNFQRAFQSALILRSDLSLLFSNLRTEFSGLLDPRKMGALEGQPTSNLQVVWENDLVDELSTPPAMDSMYPTGSVDSCMDLYRRAIEAITRLEGTYYGSDIVLVSHQDTCSVFTAAIMGTPLASHHIDWPYQLGQVRMLDQTNYGFQTAAAPQVLEAVTPQTTPEPASSPVIQGNDLSIV
mmetsp:Transcript_19778/g.23726  ORF Transcript_19778/g.23726 Transcript_19778/m.23726 type:complete len:368 (+) Transcript_19778:99-1202(+)|eukprot:CAMPEP_0197867414 /NCGR_PEP_ID=MMETSP1438-20131217/44744_1 /TAXON_ID=1461541 /ORGANISM="Pterosperma sp., Strain CCMP1384" /LENGTH=367 /DNA_ID=CAMNT_0043486063 /DNA_START=97 /DNA_END=1200 /DNA_ORIENTATION=+